MKKLLLLCITMILYMSANAQLSNPGFETINTTNDGPAAWGPAGYIIMPIDSNCYWTGQDSMGFWSSDAHTGNRAYELRVATYCTTGYAGTLQTRMFSVDTFADQREPYNDTPDAFTFYYKFNSVLGDKVVTDVSLQLSDGSQMAYGVLTIQQSTAGWTLATIPLTYYDTLIPEFVVMRFNLQNDTNMHYGTRFVVDDINHIFSTAVYTLEKSHDLRLTCYPVPAKNILHISLSQANLHPGNLLVSDALGQPIRSYPTN